GPSPSCGQAFRSCELTEVEHGDRRRECPTHRCLLYYCLNCCDDDPHSARFAGSQLTLRNLPACSFLVQLRVKRPRLGRQGSQTLLHSLDCQTSRTPLRGSRGDEYSACMLPRVPLTLCSRGRSFCDAFLLIPKDIGNAHVGGADRRDEARQRGTEQDEDEC